MKTIVILLAILTSSICASSSNVFKYAHDGDWNLMHKAMLTENMPHEEVVMTLIYYYYNIGEEDSMYFWLEHLNEYFEGKCK